MKINDVLTKIYEKSCIDRFAEIYGFDEKVLELQNKRYFKAIKNFSMIYPERKEISLFSSPGRIEICGNHTDHQQGKVLGAAINLDIIAVVSFHNERKIRINSEEFGKLVFDINNSSFELENMNNELISATVLKFVEKGVEIGGVDIYCTSNIPTGIGVSSSAAFTMLICTIINSYYNSNSMDSVELAIIGQFVESIGLHKKCGLMDQMISLLGGFVSIDFIDNNLPKIETYNYNIEDLGYHIFVIDTKSKHTDLYNDYEMIRKDMESVANIFGEKYLRFVDEDRFYNELVRIRKTCLDRAISRASHFFEENKRVSIALSALRDKNIDLFLQTVNKSGDSSAIYLQNYYSYYNTELQPITLAIMLSKRILGTRGAVRVHGGGVAGSILAFVPIDISKSYEKEIETVFGKSACKRISIRSAGNVKIM